MSFEKSAHIFDLGVCSNILGVVGEIFEYDLKKILKVKNKLFVFLSKTYSFVVDWRQNDGFLDGSDHNLP